MRNYPLIILSIAAISALFLTLAAPFLLLHHDIWWHIASGDLIRETSALPQHDIWSYTAGTQPFYLLSWLWDIAVSFLNLELLLILQIILIIFAFLLLGYICRYLGADIFTSIIVPLTALGISFTYMLPDVPISLSPQTFSIIMSVTWLACLLRRNFCLLPLLYIIWVNTHGGFPIALTALAAFGLAALLEKDWKLFGQMFVLGIICLFLTLLNPIGWHIVEAMKSTMLHVSKSFVSEWGPFLLINSLTAKIYVFLAALSLIPRRDKLMPLRILAYLWLLIGLEEKRHMIYFIIFSSPLMAAAISDFLKRFNYQINFKTYFFIPIFISIAIFWRATYPNGISIPENIYPVQEVAFIKKNSKPQRIYNDWNFGGYLIYTTRGTYPIYIDGRSGTAYPDSLFTFNAKFTDEFEKMDAIHNLYGVNLALIRRYPLLTRNQQPDSKWHQLFKGPIAEVWEWRE